MATTAALASQLSSSIRPFDGIGLCFSGGGYRATFFDLGVIAYLHRIHFEERSLLDRVIAVSSVSGGTLLAVAFAKAAQDPNYNFEQFYTSFYTAFTPENDRLLETAIAKLEDPKVWKAASYKKRSLINAFALTYSEMPFYKGTFKLFEKPKSPSLKNVCFNTTEFSYGLVYRFQNVGVFGNGPLRNSDLNELQHQIELGDIVASSSCFPMGFEPMVFPDDYFKDQTQQRYKDLKATDEFKDGVGIMDGGIADNQGIKSMLNMTRLKEVRDHFNLLVVNDVSSYKMQPWIQDNEAIDNKTPFKVWVGNIIRYFRVNPLYWLLLFLGMVIIGLNSLGLFAEMRMAWLDITGGVLIGAGLLLILLGYFLQKQKDQVAKSFQKMWKKNVPEALQDDVIAFENLEVGLLKRMLLDRMTSTFKMVYDVFLKQIRRLNYEILYTLEELDGKRMTSTVYELNGKKSPYKHSRISKEIHPKPSKALTQSALIASECQTTLWWGKQDVALDRMDHLIACGQFTTCYNLMKYVLELKEMGHQGSAIDQLWQDLENDWKLLNEDPRRWV